MRTLIATTAITAAAFLTVPATSAKADGYHYRDRAPAAAYYAPAPRYYRGHGRRWCLFDMFGFDRWGRRGHWR